MKFKRTKIYSVIFSKCPKCHEGDIFLSKNPYNLKLMAAMYPNCKVCGQATDPENGFYWGAMFVSYALTVGFGLLLGFLAVQEGFTLEQAIFVLAGLLIVLSPLTFRLSRMIWFNIFYNYEERK